MTENSPVELLEKLVGSPNNRCFGCGPHNPTGLHLEFERRDSVVRSHFVPGEWHEGWTGVIHGGLLATALDEAMAYALYFTGVKGLTARMEVRFRQAVRCGEQLVVEAAITRNTKRIVDIEGRIRRGEETVAESSGRFMKTGQLDEGMV